MVSSFCCWGHQNKRVVLHKVVHTGRVDGRDLLLCLVGFRNPLADDLELLLCAGELGLGFVSFGLEG